MSPSPVEASVDPNAAALVEELERLSHWLGREEPRRHELQTGLARLRESIHDPSRAGRALLRCAVVVDRMYSSSLKRLIRNKLAKLNAVIGGKRFARAW